MAGVELVSALFYPAGRDQLWIPEALAVKRRRLLRAQGVQKQ